MNDVNKHFPPHTKKIRHTLKQNPANLSIKYDYSQKDITMNLKIGIIFMDADGNMSIIESIYNQETGFFDFTADKVGTYFIGNVGSIK